MESKTKPGSGWVRASKEDVAKLEELFIAFEKNDERITQMLAEVSYQLERASSDANK
jgi:hypothetical protein